MEHEITQSERNGELSAAGLALCGLAALLVVITKQWPLISITLFLLLAGSRLVRLRLPLGRRAKFAVALVVCSGGALVGYLVEVGLWSIAPFTASVLLALQVVEVYSARTRSDRSRIYALSFLIAMFASSHLCAFRGLMTPRGPLVLFAYPLVVILYAACGLRVLRELVGEQERPCAGQTHPRLHVRRLAAVLLTAILVAHGLAKGLGYVERSIDRRFVLLVRRMLWIPPSYSGFSDISELGRVNELKLSREVVMRVSTSKPTPLRGRVYTHYEDGKWSATVRRERFMSDPQHRTRLRPLFRADPVKVVLLDEPFDGQEALAQQILVEPRHHASLFTPLHTVAFGGPHEFIERDQFGVVYAPVRSPGSLYHTLSLAQALEPAPAPSPEHLRVPPPLVEPLSRLAERFGGNVEDRYEKAESIAAELSSYCSYTLKPQVVEGVDPVQSFLFQTRRGHCEYFATALSLLLRSAGVPARYVVGFVPEVHNPFGDYYLVRECDAHAWVEAHFEGRGWVTMDATPGAGRAAAVPRPSRLRMWLDWARMLWRQLGVYFRIYGPLVCVTWLGSRMKALVVWLFVEHLLEVASVLVVGFLWLMLRRAKRMRAERSARAAPAPQWREEAATPELERLRLLLRRVEEQFAERGLARRPHETPLEFLRRITDTVPESRELEASRQAVSAFCRYRYGRQAPTAGELAELEEAWAAPRG